MVCFRQIEVELCTKLFNILRWKESYIWPRADDDDAAATAHPILDQYLMRKDVVVVGEREREREREKGNKKQKDR